MSVNYRGLTYRPHVVKKSITSGERFYVYVARGEELILKKDSERPSPKEITAAVIAFVDSERRKPVCRPKYIQRLIENPEGERWTYFIGTRRHGIKIGAAACVKERLKTLQSHSPVNLAVLAKVKGGELLEREYHVWFERHRKHGEWFEPHPDILAEVERLKTL